jgi:lactose/L-arabinose transport system ATP-binding protein
MIYVTHDQIEAMTLADQIVVLRAGRVEQVGPPDSLYDDPANRFVAGFIGAPRMNFLRARLEDGRLSLAAGPALPFAASPRGEVHAGVRPEHLAVGSGDATMPVTVDVVENLGGTAYIYGRTASGEEIIVETRDHRHLRAGDTVPVGYAPDRVLVFSPEGERLRPGA